MAQANIEQEKGYGDFIEHLLAEELKAKHERTRTALLKCAGFLPLRQDMGRIRLEPVRYFV